MEDDELAIRRYLEDHAVIPIFRSTPASRSIEVTIAPLNERAQRLSAKRSVKVVDHFKFARGRDLVQRTATIKALGTGPSIFGCSIKVAIRSLHQWGNGVLAVDTIE